MVVKVEDQGPQQEVLEDAVENRKRATVTNLSSVRQVVVAAERRKAVNNPPTAHPAAANREARHHVPNAHQSPSALNARNHNPVAVKNEKFGKSPS